MTPRTPLRVHDVAKRRFRKAAREALEVLNTDRLEALAHALAYTVQQWTDAKKPAPRVGKAA